jgi:hypothetical protein
MHWRRGFLRIWLVFCAVWIGGSLILELNDTKIPSLTHGCIELLDFVDAKTGTPVGAAEVAQCEATWKKESISQLNWALGPPLALLAIGGVLGWIIRGFGRSRA